MTRRRLAAWWVASALALAVVAAGAAAAAEREAPRPFEVAVMTYNVRFQSMDRKQERDGRLHPWDGRKHLVAAAIARMDPDVVGLQEAEQGQRTYLAQTLKVYDRHESILWKRDRFDRPACGSTPLPGSGRRLDWAYLRCKTTGTAIFLFNTHFPPAMKEPDKVRLCRFVADFINKTAGTEALAVLTGDLNIHDNDSRGIQTLRDAARLSDPWTDTGTSQVYTSNHWFKPTWSGHTVDWILYRRPLRARQVERPAYQVDGDYPSDHLPVYAPLATAAEKPAAP